VIALVAAPTNLGLRPPQPTSVPGCAKAPEALREAGLHSRLVAAGAVDAGVVLPGRYVDDGDPAAGRVRNQDALVDHSRRLATRLEHLLAAGHSPLVLGGDCSLLVARHLQDKQDSRLSALGEGGEIAQANWSRAGRGGC